MFRFILCFCVVSFICSPTIYGQTTSSALLENIKKRQSLQDKIALLESCEQVSTYLNKNSYLAEMLARTTPLSKYVVLSALAVGQGPIIFDGFEKRADRQRAFDTLANHLCAVERFYDYMGGVIGYHVQTIELITPPSSTQAPAQEEILQEEQLEPVPYIDIRKKSKMLDEMIADGISGLDQMAEVCVLGGAGERLHLQDEKTGMPLPVACLNFCGRSLLSGIIRDLEAREYLYYKLTKKNIFTPLLLMTSQEKDNDRHVQAICEKEHYFGRPPESIRRIIQPLAPVVTVEGSWAVSEPGTLVLKPGGHGVIWKLAKDARAFDWLVQQKRKALIVRQINNPLAGQDYGLTALAGWGLSKQKVFGFASCPRKENMSEGMNIVRSKIQNGVKRATISNIEYTEFAQRKKQDPHFGICQDPAGYPTNTNILYVDLATIIKAVDRYPIPGLLVNMKHPVDTMQNGTMRTLAGARLESTMQNIADVLDNEVQGQMQGQMQGPLSADKLRTFVLVNDRRKTMSVTKKAFEGKEISETPVGCYYDLMQQNLAMLSDVCGMTCPPVRSEAEYIQKGPQAIFLYHPALGPLYSIIGSKISGGRLHEDAELQLEISEVSLRNLTVDGSLLVTATNVTGSRDPVTHIRSFDGRVGSLIFENVTIQNKGRDRTSNTTLWTNEFPRNQSCRIILEGHSECVARNVCLRGDMEIRVPDQMRAVLSQNSDGTVRVDFEKRSS